jgi:hypothetical protein
MTLPMLCVRHEVVRGNGGIGPPILNLITTWTETRKKVARFEGKKNAFSLPEIEPRCLCFLIRSLISKLLEKFTEKG